MQKNIVIGKWARNWKIMCSSRNLGYRQEGLVRFITYGFADVCSYPRNCGCEDRCGGNESEHLVVVEPKHTSDFNRGALNEAVYIRLHTGSGDMSGEIIPLQRALYELRQAGRQWSLLLRKKGVPTENWHGTE